ncbi:MAG: response regulator transcription factor [Flavobacterium sp.]|nr:response regulator transcription factor [Flavobacterium sp.]
MHKKILICDDHLLFLNGLSEVLKKFGTDYDITLFSDSDHCQNYFTTATVDVFLCDLNIDERDGFELIQQFKKFHPKAKVIILSAYFEEFLVQKAARMGVHAFLPKETPVDELIAVIDQASVSLFNAPSIKKSTTPFVEKDGDQLKKFSLSAQEKQIIRLIIEGKTSKEIANALFISKSTVDTHRKNINKKLEISNSSSLIKFAHENNLFS